MGKFDELFVFVALVTILDGTVISLGNAKPSKFSKNQYSAAPLGYNLPDPPVTTNVAELGTNEQKNSALHNIASDSTGEEDDIDDLTSESKIDDHLLTPNVAQSDLSKQRITSTFHTKDDDISEPIIDDSNSRQEASVFDSDGNTSDSDSVDDSDSEKMVSISNPNGALHLKQGASGSNLSFSEPLSKQSKSSESSGSVSQEKDVSDFLEERVTKNINEIIIDEQGNGMTVSIPSKFSYSTSFLSEGFINRFSNFGQTFENQEDELDSRLIAIEGAITQKITLTDQRLNKMREIFDTKVSQLENHIKFLDDALKENVSLLDSLMNKIDAAQKKLENNNPLTVPTTKSQASSSPIPEPVSENTGLGVEEGSTTLPELTSPPSDAHIEIKTGGTDVQIPDKPAGNVKKETFKSDAKRPKRVVNKAKSGTPSK